MTIGLTITVCILFSGPLTGGSFNPALSFGPELILLDFPKYHWIYWLGPIGGGLWAVILYYLANHEVFTREIETKRLQGVSEASSYVN